MDQEIDSDEEMLSDDAGYTSDLSERDTDYVERFVPSSEIHALNSRTKHCIIHCYYTTGDRLSICAECMIRLADTDIAGLYLVRKHDIGHIYALSGQACTNCRLPTYVIFPCNKSLLWWNISRGCNDATNASSSLKNFVVPSVRVSPLDTEYASGEYASRDERSLVWREIDAPFESRISTGAVINSNHIEPRRFLEDAKEIVFERVRDAVERHVVRATRRRAYPSIARRIPGTRQRMPAHANCNLNYKNSFYIPIVFHNSGYDAHFVIKEIATAFEGHVDILPITKEKYNDDYYAALLDRFNNILKKKRPHLAKKKVLFHQDNARVHASMAKFNEFHYELFSHPTYSPDLVPYDYFLFSKLKKWFGRKRFTTREQLIAETEAYLEGLDKLYFSDGLKKLENRWIKCIELKGDYIEK
ncbi:SETMR methyltransferase, partial [Pseudoatta argentina]